MANGLSEWEKQELQKYLRQDKRWTNGAQWTVVALGGIAYCVTCSVTQPWPRKGPGGGYGTNIAGPGIAILVTLAVVLVFGKLLRRRTPLQPPRIGFDDPPSPQRPWQTPLSAKRPPAARTDLPGLTPPRSKKR